MPYRRRESRVNSGQAAAILGLIGLLLLVIVVADMSTTRYHKDRDEAMERKIREKRYWNLVRDEYDLPAEDYSDRPFNSPVDFSH